MPLDPAEFPGLREGGYRVTSPEDRRYNCISWAINDSSRFWWPDRSHFYAWPRTVARTRTLNAFSEMFREFGFKRCDNATLEAGFEKIALFIDEIGRPLHAARQLPSGRWTSKMGMQEDIEHDLHDLEGDAYGRVHAFFRRPST